MAPVTAFIWFPREYKICKFVESRGVDVVPRLISPTWVCQPVEPIGPSRERQLVDVNVSPFEFPAFRLYSITEQHCGARWGFIRTLLHYQQALSVPNRHPLADPHRSTSINVLAGHC
jgi:hypothetical protein